MTHDHTAENPANTTHQPEGHNSLATPEETSSAALSPEELQARATRDQQEREEEQKLIRRLQMMMNMVMQVIAQDGTLTVDDASQMIADSRKAALSMFPGKEVAYDLIWRPRFQRLMRERFRIM